MTPLKVFQKLLEVRDQSHYLHLNTTSYAQHKALDTFYNEWLSLTDEFVETYQGQYGRITGECVIVINNNLDALSYVGSLIEFIDNEMLSIINSKDKDLDNIIADFRQLVNQTTYMLTMS